MQTLRNIIKNTLWLLPWVFFVGCGQQNFSKGEMWEFDGKFPDQSTKNAELTFSDSGYVNFRIIAPVLNQYSSDPNNEYSDCPNGIKIISYDTHGEPEAILTAEYAIDASGNQRMEARKHVVITNLKQGDTIKTEKIIWDKQRKKIFSDVEVRQIRADGTIYIGDGFDADEKFTKYTVRNPRGEMLSDNI